MEFCDNYYKPVQIDACKVRAAHNHITLVIKIQIGYIYNISVTKITRRKNAQ